VNPIERVARALVLSWAMVFTLGTIALLAMVPLAAPLTAVPALKLFQLSLPRRSSLVYNEPCPERSGH
jgi:hypothetical protein